MNTCASRPSTPRGPWAEGLALAFLRKRGLKLRVANYRCRRGEIDLVMEDGEALVFVEVRYRSRDDYGHALETVGTRKRARILSTAAHYLQTNPLTTGRPCRFDVVSVSGPTHRPELQWIPRAFET